ncbi:hypothetical protein P0Y35_06840 [Kiritimatiellaeota bacterium B1221]|nr:hypothetical protein [Kiritimatiellaeota bacterium B1221]
MPTARDSVMASEVSQAMLDDATGTHAPCAGTPEDMAEILDRRGNSKKSDAGDA